MYEMLVFMLHVYGMLTVINILTTQHTTQTVTTPHNTAEHYRRTIIVGGAADFYELRARAF